MAKFEDAGSGVKRVFFPVEVDDPWYNPLIDKRIEILKRLGLTDLELNLAAEVIGESIEDMYKTYRVTKGRQGLNPNPDKRQPENPWVTQTRKVKPGIFVANPMTGRFPITELMSKPIQYSTPS